MIVSIWVFFMLGEPDVRTHATPYVQVTASPWEHDYAPEDTEQTCAAEFHAKYPSACVCDSGWHRQEVRVMGG